MERSGREHKGQQYDPQTDLVIPYTEKQEDYSTADPKVDARQARTEITPTDAQNSLVRSFQPPTAELATYVREFPGVASFQLPDTLVSVAISYNKTESEGHDTHPVSQQDVQFQGAGSASLSPHARANASASILVDISPVIRQTLANNVPTRNFLVYMEGNFTVAQLLTKLNTHLAPTTVAVWPKFKPESHTILLKGQQFSVGQTASSRAQLTGSGDSGAGSYEYGDGASIETGVSITAKTLPHTIHGLVTFTGNGSETADATVDVEASTKQLSVIGSTPPVIILPITNDPDPVTVTATASVTPTSLAATSGVSAIPTSGLYLRDIQVSPYKWQHSIVIAEVVDFSYFA